MTALVERARFRPGRSGWISSFVRGEELPPAFFQGGYKTILRQDLPRGNQPRGEHVACFTLKSFCDRRCCGFSGGRDRRNGRPLPVALGFNTNSDQFVRQLLGNVHPQSVRNNTSRPAAASIGLSRLETEFPLSRMSCCRWRAVFSSHGK